MLFRRKLQHVTEQTEGKHRSPALAGSNEARLSRHLARESEKKLAHVVLSGNVGIDDVCTRRLWREEEESMASCTCDASLSMGAAWVTTTASAATSAQRRNMVPEERRIVVLIEAGPEML